MKNKSKVLIVAFLSFLQISCYKDKTTEDIHSISDIKIEFKNNNQTQMNIDKNEDLVIDPIITQSKDGMELTYEWQVNYEVVSTEKDLHYTATQLGTFPVRLKVSNKDGSTFKSFKLNVNSPYEEGLVVLGEDDNGEGTLSFMRKFSASEIASGRVEGFATNVFSLNNPDNKIGKGPSDVVRRLNQLFISSKDEGKISVINGKTFELESVISAPEFSDFKPLKLNIPETAFASSIILNADGQLFTVATRENLILRSTLLQVSGASDPLFGVKLAFKTAFLGTANFTDNYFWDQTHSRLWNFWYTKSHSKNELANQDLIHFFPTNGLVYVLTKDKNEPSKLTKTIFGEYIQEFFADPIDLKEKVVFTNASPTLKESSITLLNEKYLKLVYANDRSIYNWFYSGEDIPSSPYITIDGPGVITSLASNPAGTELYVGVYEEAASGLKGSVLVYNIDNGNLIKRYEGVADKPIKVYYKVKS